MMKLTGTISKLQKSNVLIIGDLMLDQYTFGDVLRISPEAPVSVLKVISEKMLPGGAGNVILNLLSLGANVKAIGRIGSDTAGETLLKLLNEKNADTSLIFIQKNYKTPLKNRFIAANQQILRVDFENVIPIDDEIESEIIKNLPSILKDIQVVAISDYAKGFLSDNLIRAVIDIAKSKNIPVIIDPKGKDFSKYKEANIIKPNLKEAYGAANLTEKDPIDKAAQIILKDTNIDNLIITRSQDGISLFTRDKKRFDFPPSQAKEIKDVTGSGDSVLAMICLAIANNLDLCHACQLSNVAASINIEHVGCVQVTLHDVANRLLENDTQNKIFDFSHLFALKKVLEMKKYSLLLLSSKQGFTTSVFKSIKNLSNEDEKTIIYIIDSNINDEFIELLSSLSEVDFIILKNENFKDLINEIEPTNIFYLKNDSLTRIQKKDFVLDHF